MLLHRLAKVKITMTTQPHISPYPSFDPLTLDKNGPRENAWGVWGPYDQLGTLEVVGVCGRLRRYNFSLTGEVGNVSSIFFFCLLLAGLGLMIIVMVRSGGGCASAECVGRFFKLLSVEGM
jgi:hypothetical protein